MKSSPLFSIIIPVQKINPLIEDCVNKILESSYHDFEIIILVDKKSKPPKFLKTKIIETGSIGPAEKRDIGAASASGEVLAFIDDDAYPSRDWLKHAFTYFTNENITAVCGPGVTPPQDSIFQKVSGWVSASKIGSGPYTYRFIPQSKRVVDDYPSMNLIIRKKDFQKIGGFDTNYWPGEDTKLCLDLTQKLHKKIIYDPNILVYHHRRPILAKHLLQNGRYGLHRGFFARTLPETSRRLSYFLPSLFTLALVFGWTTMLFNKSLFYLYLFFVFSYFFIIIFESFKIYFSEKNILISLLFIPSVVATHLWYGVQFIHGFFFTKKIKQ